MDSSTTNQPQDVELSTMFERADGDGELFSLPKADSGKDAWLFLASTVVFEAMTWGMCQKQLDSYLLSDYSQASHSALVFFNLFTRSILLMAAQASPPSEPLQLA
jgi:hypothetical protein